MAAERAALGAGGFEAGDAPKRCGAKRQSKLASPRGPAAAERAALGAGGFEAGDAPKRCGAKRQSKLASPRGPWPPSGPHWEREDLKQEMLLSGVERSDKPKEAPFTAPLERSRLAFSQLW